MNATFIIKTPVPAFKKKAKAKDTASSFIQDESFKFKNWCKKVVY